jgi:hypothetical protein
MQNTVPVPSKTVDVANHDVVLNVGDSPTMSHIPKPEELDEALRNRLIRDGQHGAFVEENHEDMPYEEIKVWTLGIITQYEQQHSLTLQELQTALSQHATTVATAQTTAQSAQSSSKYAVYAAIVTGTCSVIVCIASSLMSHYL